jgi:hypothetical protein
MAFTAHPRAGQVRADRRAGSPTPRAGWPGRTSTRESAARSARVPPGNSRRDNPASRPVRPSCQGRHGPGRQGSSCTGAVRLAPDTRALSAAAARAARGRGRAARQRPLPQPRDRAAVDRREEPGRTRTAPRGPVAGSPVPDRAATDRAVTGRPDRTVGAWSPDRTGDRARPDPPDAPRGRTTGRADRTVPRRHRSGRPGLRPARRSAPSGNRPGCPERRTRRRERGSARQGRTGVGAPARRVVAAGFRGLPPYRGPRRRRSAWPALAHPRGRTGSQRRPDKATRPGAPYCLLGAGNEFAFHSALNSVAQAGIVLTDAAGW